MSRAGRSERPAWPARPRPWAVGQPRQQFLGGFVEIGRLHGVVDQSPVGGVGCRSPFRRAAASASRAPGPPAGAAARSRPESGLKPLFDERLPEHRVGRGHGEVGGQREIAAQADGPAPHGADHGQVDGVHSSITRCAAWGMRRTRSPVRGRCPPLWWRPSRRPRRSRRPAPRMWIARNESSAAASVNASTSSSTIEWLNELRRAGRSSVSRRIAPSRCAVTDTVSVDQALDSPPGPLPEPYTDTHTVC